VTASKPASFNLFQTPESPFPYGLFEPIPRII